jgi:hypothetical protein
MPTANPWNGGDVIAFSIALDYDIKFAWQEGKR